MVKAAELKAVNLLDLGIQFNLALAGEQVHAVETFNFLHLHLPIKSWVK